MKQSLVKTIRCPGLIYKRGPNIKFNIFKYKIMIVMFTFVIFLPMNQYKVYKICSLFTNINIYIHLYGGPFFYQVP